MALSALTLSVTQGVQGRPFQAKINGLTTGRVEALGESSPGFSVVNGNVMSASLPYATSTIALREYEPGVGQGFRDTRIDITASTEFQLRAQAIASLGVGRSLIRAGLAQQRQADGTYVYSLMVQDDLGATRPLDPGTGTPPPSSSARKTYTFLDNDSDADDTAMKAMQARLHQQNIIEIIGDGVDSMNDHAAPTVRVLLDRAGLAAVPVGAYKANGIGGGNASDFCTTIRNEFAVPNTQTRSDFPDAVTSARQVISAQPDGSVYFVVAGTGTSFAQFLASPADGISPLTGLQMVAQKGAQVDLMAGHGTNNAYVEANAAYDIDAANYIAANCPIPMYWATFEVGDTVYTRIPYYVAEASDPYQRIWTLFDNNSKLSADTKERNSWDLMAALHSAIGNDTVFTEGPLGTISFNGTGFVASGALLGVQTPGAQGTTNFVPGAGKSRILGKAATDGVIRNRINKLIYEFISAFKPNLVQNGRFDNNEMAPWSTSAQTGTAVYNFGSFDNVLTMQSSGAGTRASVHQDLGVLPAGTYEYAIEFRSGGTVNIAIESALATGNLVALNGHSTSTTPRLKGQFVLAEPTTVIIRFQRTNTTSGTTVHIDNVNLAKIA